MGAEKSAVGNKWAINNIYQVLIVPSKVGPGKLQNMELEECSSIKSVIGNNEVELVICVCVCV